MAKKDSSKHIWTDPKDFGLPPVDIAPLVKRKSTKVEEKKVFEPKKPEVHKEDKTSEEMVLAAKAMAAKKLEAQKIEETSQIVASEEKAVPATPKKEIPRKSKSWVLWVALIGLALVSAITWQLIKVDTSAPISDEVLAEAVGESEGPGEIVSDSEIDAPIDNGSESTDSSTEPQGPVENLAVEENPTVEVPENVESGTTIDQNNPGELIRVETKPSPSQYFIIVGSLPNERLALNEASKYWDRNNELYLLSPTEDSENYRLAIGRFNGFTPANAELQRVKSEYTEALWILKY
ncbi:hypothetical protein [Algoriphagus sediminis]|uniref:SPOR domain-containing protein n=1 Tax=Algoriphagus sediminis TaxID=3057113 RepID=A0ABT7YAT4_9BACT|nr:hypothetical protein [Algoriphagus sediminis]MDN3203608.1 hypothetical protein [Algoriphagus sediminis]